MGHNESKQVNVLLTFDISEEPNETKLVAIKFNGSSMEFRSFSGFAAKDIFDLVTTDKEEVNND